MIRGNFSMRSARQRAVCSPSTSALLLAASQTSRGIPRSRNGRRSHKIRECCSIVRANGLLMVTSPAARGPRLTRNVFVRHRIRRRVYLMKSHAWFTTAVRSDVPTAAAIALNSFDPRRSSTIRQRSSMSTSTTRTTTGCTRRKRIATPPTG